MDLGSSATPNCILQVCIKYSHTHSNIEYLRIEVLCSKLQQLWNSNYVFTLLYSECTSQVLNLKHNMQRKCLFTCHFCNHFYRVEPTKLTILEYRKQRCNTWEYQNYNFYLWYIIRNLINLFWVIRFCMVNTQKWIFR